MRKLIESTLVSLNGVVEAPQSWAVFDDEAKALAVANLQGYDAFVMGRATYEFFRAAWSPIHGDEYIDTINAARKYVMSNTLSAVTWNAELMKGDAAIRIKELKGRPGKDLIKYGTSLLDQTLLEHRLIDEFQFWIFPVVVSSGKHLFDDLASEPPALRLTGTRALESGVVILTYAPE
jgi:dihydrofolate reductase